MERIIKESENGHALHASNYKLEDIFKSVKPWETFGGICCSVRLSFQYENFAVELTDEIAELWKKQFCSSQDSVDFEIIQQKNNLGRCLVLFKNSQIISSRWLCYVDTADVRKFFGL